MKTFNSKSTTAERVVQSWIILIHYAKNHQLITYEDLSIEMYGHSAPQAVGRILIQDFYCRENGLPSLTSIVVNKTTNKPGENIPMNLDEVEEEQKAVFKYDWFNVVIPSAES